MALPPFFSTSAVKGLSQGAHTSIRSSLWPVTKSKSYMVSLLCQHCCLDSPSFAVFLSGLGGSSTTGKQQTPTSWLTTCSQTSHSGMVFNCTLLGKFNPLWVLPKIPFTPRWSCPYSERWPSCMSTASFPSSVVLVPDIVLSSCWRPGKASTDMIRW